jgi:hypothetical protein
MSHSRSLRGRAADVAAAARLRAGRGRHLRAAVARLDLHAQRCVDEPPFGDRIEAARGELDGGAKGITDGEAQEGTAESIAVSRAAPIGWVDLLDWHGKEPGEPIRRSGNLAQRFMVGARVAGPGPPGVQRAKQTASSGTRKSATFGFA